MVQNKMIKTIIIFLLLFGSNVYAIDLKKYYQEDLTETDKKAIVIFNILPVSYTHLTLPTNREV